MKDNFAVYGLYCVCESCQLGGETIRYVGQTRRSVTERLAEHLKNSRREKTHRIGGLPLYRWIRKHGAESIRLRTFSSGLDGVSVDEEEIRLISELGTRAPDGLNMTDGGLGKSGYKHSEETKRAISKKKLGVPGFSKSGLTSEQVAEIKRRLWCGETQASLSDEFEVTRKTLKDISQGLTWNHVPWPVGPREKMRTREERVKLMKKRSRDERGRLVKKGW